jgi:hypothetical protein
MKNRSFWARFNAVIAGTILIIFIVMWFLTSSPNPPSWTHLVLIVYLLVNIVGAVLDFRNRRFVASRRRLIMTIMVLLLGCLWGAGAILSSTPNAPLWTRYAMPVLGAVSGVAIAVVWSVLHFGKRADASVQEK